MSKHKLKSPKTGKTFYMMTQKKIEKFEDIIERQNSHPCHPYSFEFFKIIKYAWHIICVGVLLSEKSDIHFYISDPNKPPVAISKAF